MGVYQGIEKVTPTEQDSGKEKESADTLKNWHIYTVWYDL